MSNERGEHFDWRMLKGRREPGTPECPKGVLPLDKMKWSWRIGRIAGIGVYMHVTFLILLAWVAASHYLVRHRWDDALSGLGFILALFAIVVLHELGHALT